jgi:hypothetical protein
MDNQDQQKLRLSDEDIELIVTKVCDKIENNLYHNVGKGIMQLAFKGIIIGLLVLAAYGAGVKGWINF